LSDQELRLLKSSASDLQGNLNKDVFKNRLEATISALNKAINGSNTETQNIPSGYPSSAFDLLNTIAIG
jgi:hypothetical protein